MKLIPEWRKAWRMVSVQAMALAATIQGAWMAIPPDLLQQVPSEIVRGVTLTLLVLGIIGRLVKQEQVSG
jgi:hypothetical protein